MIQGLLIIVLMAGTFLLSATVVAQNEPVAYAEEQAIAPSLARQGDFALRLVQSLGLPTAEDEQGAIGALNALGIHAVDGWMADYPMTPQIVMELRDAVIATAAAGQLNMDVDAAMRAYAELVVEFGLPPPLDVAPGYVGGGAPATTYVPYCDGGALDYYYDSFGTPIYTYCRPPPAYLYLYSWVPCGFQWQGHAFTGFFILKHFDRIPSRVRHEQHRGRIADVHGEKHERDDRFHRREFQTSLNSPPQRQHVFSDESQWHAAATGVGNKGNPRWQVHAPGTSPPQAMVEPGAIPSPATPGVERIHRTYSNRVWTGEHPNSAARLSDRLTTTTHTDSTGEGGAVKHRVVTAESHKLSTQSSTGRMRTVPQPQRASAPAPVRATVTPPASAPALVQAPPAAAPIERRSVSRETSGWGWSDNRGAARAGGLGFR